jgi:hypothetical protein
MRAVIFLTSFDIAPAVLQVLVESFQILLRVERGFFEMVQQALYDVRKSPKCRVPTFGYTLIVEMYE